MNTPETNYFEDKDVVVTNSQVMLKGKNFPMVNITSVSMVEKSPKRALWIFLALLSIFVSGINFSSSEGVNLFLDFVGLLMLITGITMAIILRKQYIVRISSAGGETDGLISPNRKYIQEVVDAVSQAIFNRDLLSNKSS